MYQLLGTASPSLQQLLLPLVEGATDVQAVAVFAGAHLVAAVQPINYSNAQHRSAAPVDLFCFLATCFADNLLSMQLE